MSLVDELQRLDELHQNGSLTDAEFAQAKAKLLAKPGESGDQQQMTEQLQEVRHQNELARVDREWEMERQHYMITTKYGRQIVPTTGMAIGTILVAVLFGGLWTIMAIAITGSAPDFGPFAIAKFVFPLFGLVFIVLGIGWGIYCYSRATKYNQAFREYQTRRGNKMHE